MALDCDEWAYSCPIDIDPDVEVPCTMWVGAGGAPELYPTQICTRPVPVASRCTDRAIVGGKGGWGGEHLLACVHSTLSRTFLIIGDCTSGSFFHCSARTIVQFPLLTMYILPTHSSVYMAVRVRPSHPFAAFTLTVTPHSYTMTLVFTELG